MASTTTNLGLRKPANDDYINVGTDINGNMDILDSAIGAVPSGTSAQSQLGGIESGFAILATGDTHAAITSGQYVYVRAHSTLTDGLYKATANIAQNASLAGSVTAADGVFNSIAEKMNNCFFMKQLTTTLNGSVSSASFYMPNNSAGIITVGGFAPITIGMSNNTVYSSGMPTNWSISQNGNTVTVSRSSASAVYFVLVLLFAL